VEQLAGVLQQRLLMLLHSELNYLQLNHFQLSYFQLNLFQLNYFQLNHSQPINFLFNDFKLNCLQLTHKSVLTGQIIQQADTPLAPLWRDKSSMTKPGCRYGWVL